METLPAGIERHGPRFRVRKMAHGKTIRRSFDTLSEAERFLTMVVAETTRMTEARQRRLVTGLTVMDVVERWFAGRRPRLTPGVIRDYEDTIRVHISRIGKESAAEIARSPRRLRAFYDTCPPVRALRVHTILKQA